jgi:hypothetical protein
MAIAIGTMRRREGSPNCREKKSVIACMQRSTNKHGGIEALKEKKVGD